MSAAPRSRPAPASLASPAALVLLLACPAPPADPGDPSTTAASSSASGETPTGSGFVVALDAPTQECDPGAQDCPADQKCTPFAREPGCCVDSTHCVADAGDKLEGEPCTRERDSDDCAKGLFCLTATSGGSGDGTCVGLCDPLAADPCGAGACVQFNDGVLPLCRPPCDPLAPDCPEGQACYGVLTEQAFVCLGGSYPEDGGDIGDPCDTVSGCRAGLLCAPQPELAACAADLCCTPVCPIGATTCPPPLSCEQAFDPDDFPAYASVGYCRVPEN